METHTRSHQSSTATYHVCVGVKTLKLDYSSYDHRYDHRAEKKGLRPAPGYRYLSCGRGCRRRRDTVGKELTSSTCVFTHRGICLERNAQRKTKRRLQRSTPFGSTTHLDSANESGTLPSLSVRLSVTSLSAAGEPVEVEMPAYQVRPSRPLFEVLPSVRDARDLNTRWAKEKKRRQQQRFLEMQKEEAVAYEEAYRMRDQISYRHNMRMSTEAENEALQIHAARSKQPNLTSFRQDQPRLSAEKSITAPSMQYLRDRKAPPARVPALAIRKQSHTDKTRTTLTKAQLFKGTFMRAVSHHMHIFLKKFVAKTNYTVTRGRRTVYS